MGLTGRVLITGGAGFLARGIYRRSRAESWPVRFTALSRDDAKHHKLQLQYPEVATVLGDVSTIGERELALLMRGFDMVIHAAASKYVDRAELNALDTIATNVEGSRRVARAAQHANVGRAIAISTDKACHPVNTYGASKLLMERIWQEQSDAYTTFTGVRYGNVVGSTGSVLTLFEQQLIERGYLTLTDPGMTRFWMTVDEAVDVILAAAEAPSRVMVIPKMRAASMHDVACAALGYDEHRPLPLTGGQPQVKIVGVRPGEKKHEAIIHAQESVRVTEGDGFRAPWHLHAPGFPTPDDARTFSVSSDDPPRGWIPIPELREMVADAAEV